MPVPSGSVVKLQRPAAVPQSSPGKALGLLAPVSSTSGNAVKGFSDPQREELPHRPLRGRRSRRPGLHAASGRGKPAARTPAKSATEDQRTHRRVRLGRRAHHEGERRIALGPSRDRICDRPPASHRLGRGRSRTVSPRFPPRKGVHHPGSNPYRGFVAQAPKVGTRTTGTENTDRALVAAAVVTGLVAITAVAIWYANKPASAPTAQVPAPTPTGPTPPVPPAIWGIRSGPAYALSGEPVP